MVRLASSEQVNSIPAVCIKPFSLGETTYQLRTQLSALFSRKDKYPPPASYQILLIKRLFEFENTEAEEFNPQTHLDSLAASSSIPFSSSYSCFCILFTDHQSSKHISLLETQNNHVLLRTANLQLRRPQVGALPCSLQQGIPNGRNLRHEAHLRGVSCCNQVSDVQEIRSYLAQDSLRQGARRPMASGGNQSRVDR
jgi:hypothetical protein